MPWLSGPNAGDQARSRHDAVSYGINVAGAKADDDTFTRFDPRDFMEGEHAPLVRPRFLPIIASNVSTVKRTRFAALPP